MGNTDNGLRCLGCGDNPKSLKPKFKVYIRVVNDSGLKSFTLFDNHVRTLIIMSAHDLRKRYIEDPDIIPDELNEILGRSFLFKFLLEAYNRDEDFHYYTVVTLTDDSYTIVAFKKGLYVDTEPVADTYILPRVLTTL